MFCLTMLVMIVILTGAVNTWAVTTTVNDITSIPMYRFIRITKNRMQRCCQFSPTHGNTAKKVSLLLGLLQGYAAH